MSQQKILHRLTVLVVLLLVILIAAAIGSYVYLQAQQNQISDYNRLVKELDGAEFNLDFANLSIIDLPNNIQHVQNIQTPLNKLAQLQQQERDIESDFTLAYAKLEPLRNKYSTSAELLQTLPDSKSIPLRTKRQADNAILDIYRNFRAKVATQRQTGGNLPWYFIPDLEIQVMSEREKAGQLIMLPASSTSLNNADKALLQQQQIGGMILMGNNVSTSTQLKQYTAQLQQTANLYPLFLAIDQEGAPVKRINWDTTLGQKAMAGQLKLEQACDQYKQRDQLISDHGINVNFGLVADITKDAKSFIYNRIFSSDGIIAGKYIAQAAQCSTKASMTAKHFPGHGRTNADTHKGMSSYQLDIKTWQAEDGKMFQTAIDNGIDWIMLGHLQYTNITGNQPATLSKQAVDYLRNDMKFKGLVVTDDLGMLASDKNRNNINDLTAAARAGSDQILYVRQVISPEQILTTLEPLAKAKELDQQVLRVLNYKLRLLP